MYSNHKTYESKALQCNFAKQSKISPTASYWRPATKDIVEAKDNKNRANSFAEFYMTGYPERRGRVGR